MAGDENDDPLGENLVFVSGTAVIDIDIALMALCGGGLVGNAE